MAYYAYLAADGPEAVRVVTREKPDLILLDLIFPVDAANVGGALQDGFFIIQWLRRMGEAEDIPIIVISGDNSKRPATGARRGSGGLLHQTD